MTSDIRNIQMHAFEKADRLLLDANVWLLTHGPSPADRRREPYANAFKKMREARAVIHLAPLVLSEFVNRYARLLYEQLAARPPTFKDWRKTPDFVPAAKEIATSAKKMVRASRPCDLEFPTLKLEELLDEFGAGDRDFNDQLIAQLCRRENLTLVTDDSDFADHGLTILTANNRLLGS